MEKKDHAPDTLAHTTFGKLGNAPTDREAVLHWANLSFFLHFAEQSPRKGWWYLHNAKNHSFKIIWYLPSIRTVPRNVHNKTSRTNEKECKSAVQVFFLRYKFGWSWEEGRHFKIKLYYSICTYDVIFIRYTQALTSTYASKYPSSLQRRRKTYSKNTEANILFLHVEKKNQPTRSCYGRRTQAPLREKGSTHGLSVGTYLLVSCAWFWIKFTMSYKSPNKS